MIATLRASTRRAAAGALMATLAAGVFLFALPGASRRRERSEMAAREAQAALQRQEEEVRALQAEAARIQDDRRAMEELLGHMTSESLGSLQWKLSRRLFELSGKDGVRLVSVKYGAPSKEGAKGSDLEAVDVEFTVTGIFKDLKVFMLGLEGSRLPFAVVNAKLDEVPAEGGHLTVLLRAFRQASGPRREEGA